MPPAYLNENGAALIEVRDTFNYGAKLRVDHVTVINRHLGCVSDWRRVSSSAPPKTKSCAWELCKAGHLMEIEIIAEFDCGGGS